MWLIGFLVVDKIGGSEFTPTALVQDVGRMRGVINTVVLIPNLTESGWWLERALSPGWPGFLVGGRSMRFPRLVGLPAVLT